MIRTIRGSLLTIAVALSAVAVGALLSVAVIRSERERNRLLAQYEAERIASGLSLLIAQAIRDEETGAELTAPIIRAATYDARGRVERIRIGHVPPRVDPRMLAPGEDRFEYHRDTESLTLYRRRWVPAGAFGRNRRSIDNEFILLEVDASSYFRTERRLAAAQIASPVLIAVIVGAVAALVQTNARYRRRLDEQRQLVQLGAAARTIAHEIRNPLSAIRLKTGLLRRTSSADATPELDVIDEEVRRLTLLADRVSDFIRDPAGHPETVLLAPFLTSLAERFPTVQVAAPNPAVPSAVRFDRERLRSVLENLVQNAIESGGEAPVTVTAHRAGRSVVVQVADRGAGIASTQQEQVFQPFFTTKSKGTGIGLAIALNFVKAAGGTLKLLPRRGGGTEAHLTLPAADGS